MRLRMFAVLAVLGTLTPAARAQVGLYGKLDYLRYSDGASPSTSTNYTGGGVGIYDDFTGLGPVRLGLDLRGDLVNESNSTYRALLGGVRVAVRIPVVAFRPYVQGSIGVGGGKPKGPFAYGITNVSYSNKLTYAGFAGVDTRVLPHLDWRVLELGFGSQSGFGGSQPKLFTVSSGLVARF